MDKTLEKIINIYGDHLDAYAEEISKDIEMYLNTNNIEVYDAKIDEDSIDKYSINISDSEAYIKYLKNHNVTEVFRCKKILFKESFAFHFRKRIYENARHSYLENEDAVEEYCDLYEQYIDIVVGDSICSKVMYCIESSPIIACSCDTDLGKILGLEDSLLEDLLQPEYSVEEIVVHINAAEKELKEAFEFLINDVEFNECTNAALRKDYKNREVLFQNNRFPNLYWMISNSHKIDLEDRKLHKRKRDVYSSYDALYEYAWRQIRYNNRGY